MKGARQAMSAVPGLEDIPEFEGNSEMVDLGRVPGLNRLLVERHRPLRFRAPYHHHTSIEINFLEGCNLEYSFSGRQVKLPPNRITIFWGAVPHCVTDVEGVGIITNVYLSLGRLLHWSLPSEMVNPLLAGCVISARTCPDSDAHLFERLFLERSREEVPWRRLHLAEVETRLRRIALEGWDELLDSDGDSQTLMAPAASMRHVELMIRFIADNHSSPINVGEIVESANLSQGHAMKLFRQIMGRSIKEHLTQTRLSHARMLLHETDAKIVTIAYDSGFRSLSSFYGAFVSTYGVSPARYRKDNRTSSNRP